MNDNNRTPFNIGRAIDLTGFQLNESGILSEGLSKLNNPQSLLKEVLTWTSGQPFITQKLCKLILQNSETFLFNPKYTEAELVETIVQNHLITNWEANDEPKHLRTIRDRILSNKRLFTDLKINTVQLRIFGIDFGYIETLQCNVSTKDLGLN